MKNFFRKHSEKITAFFLAVVFTFGFSFSVVSHLAFASDLGSYSDYNASNWEEVGEDARELAQAYLEVLKSTSLGNYFDEVTDIPISWLKLAGDGTYALSPISSIYYLLNSNGVLEVENTSSSHSGRHRVGDEHDDVVVDSDTFKKVIDDTDLVFYPTGRINKISWKTDKFLKSNDLNFDRLGRVTFLYQGDFFYEKNLKECYCALYYYDGTDYFYSQNGFHFYLDDWSDDSGGSGTSLFYDQYNFLEIADVSNDNQAFEDINGTPYIDFSVWYSPPYSYSFSGYSELGQYFSNNRNYIAAAYWSPYADFAKYFYPSNSLTDLREHYLHSNIQQFFGSKSPYCSGMFSLPVDNVPCDWGFIYSDQKFTMDGFGADIDTSKIPDSYYITVSGDTIYDYSITNPDTGQSSTVNEYITNNYTYITNNPGGDGSKSSGTVCGNVTVGGNVGVNGNVNVGGEVKFGGEVNVGVEVSPIDINLNVSGNAGSIGAGESVPDPDLPDTSIFDGYLNDALDETTGIRKFIADFFGGLPGEITTLVCIGLVLAILCRLFGR